MGSASLELDENANIISYEEYHPFGTTSYRSGRTETETSQKRYKYVGKERDEETGLYYYGFRYYAAWLCRFVSVDPLQFEYPHYTPFQYAGNIPISYIDLDGLEEYDPNDDYKSYGYGPTRPLLFWKERPDFEIKKEGKNLNTVTYYQTEGIHTNDRLLKGASKMLVAHTYFRGDKERFYFYDNGANKWLPFNPNNIGLDKEEATTAFAYSVGTTGVIVGGMAFYDSGVFLNHMASKKELIESGLKFAIDAVNQYFIKGRNIKEVDFANSFFSAVVKNSYVKNFLQSLIDVSVSEQRIKNADETMNELTIRTLVDGVFGLVKQANSFNPNPMKGVKSDEDLTYWVIENGFMDYFKKWIRGGLKEISKEQNDKENNK